MIIRTDRLITHCRQNSHFSKLRDALVALSEELDADVDTTKLTPQKVLELTDDQPELLADMLLTDEQFLALPDDYWSTASASAVAVLAALASIPRSANEGK